MAAAPTQITWYKEFSKKEREKGKKKGDNSEEGKGMKQMVSDALIFCIYLTM